jgi:hypothetical protein
MNPNLIFSNPQHVEWLWREFENYVEAASENLRDDLKKRDREDAMETLEWAAITKMNSQAVIELAHHNQKLKKCCGFGNCKYLPSCLRGLE